MLFIITGMHWTFQIVDDLLDVAGDSKIIGKNNGDDFRERKHPYHLLKPFHLVIKTKKTSEANY